MTLSSSDSDAVLVSRLGPMTVGRWIKQASIMLAELDTPRLDADLLMCHALQCDRTALFARPEKELTDNQLSALQALLERRLKGEPISYLTGEREFWSLNFDVNKDVLVPRADTELMVELGLQALQDGCDSPVLDAGTGSGVIAIALYLQWHKDHQGDQHASLPVVASDVSNAALTMAKRNAAKLGATNIDFIHSDWLAAFDDNSMGLILSNPPYIALNDPHMQNDTLGFEPVGALVSGEDGLDAIRIIVEQAVRVGKPGCRVYIEHGYEQAEDVQNIMRNASFTQVQTHKDINDQDRVTGGYCP